MNTPKSKSAKCSSSSTKTDRKTIEKNRRNNMKCLYNQLNSLVHLNDDSSSKEILALPDQIDEATEYIKKLEKNVAELKKKKDSLMNENGFEGNSSKTNNNNNISVGNKRCYTLNSPVQIEVNDKDNDVEVILVTGLECQFVFTEAIRIVHEELAEVVNASYSVVGSTVFHSIHAKMGDCASSEGVTRIHERLKKFAL